MLPITASRGYYVTKNLRG